MDDKPKQRNATAVVVSVLVGVVVLLPVLYALSIGPAYYVGWSETHNLIYGPLDSAAAAFPPLDEFLQWYVQLWK